jgi:hypothetical protein
LCSKALIGQAKPGAQGAHCVVTNLLKQLINFAPGAAEKACGVLLQRNNLLDSSLCTAHIAVH